MTTRPMITTPTQSAAMPFVAEKDAQENREALAKTVARLSALKPRHLSFGDALSIAYPDRYPATPTAGETAQFLCQT